MVKDQLIELTQNYITGSGAIPVSIGIPEFERIISDASRWFYQNYRHAVQHRYYLIEKEKFDTAEFKSTRQITLPDCVVSVAWVREANNANFIGILDRDITEQRMIAAEIYFAPYGSDDLIYRTVNYAYYDLTKAFFMDYIQYDYNMNSHRLSIIGRNPRYNALLLTNVKIAEEALYDDPYFIDYVRAQALISMGRIYSFFNYNLAGGVTINAAEISSRGDQLLEEVKQRIKEEDAPDIFFNGTLMDIKLIQELVYDTIGSSVMLDEPAVAGIEIMGQYHPILYRYNSNSISFPDEGPNHSIPRSEIPKNPDAYAYVLKSYDDSIEQNKTKIINYTYKTVPDWMNSLTIQNTDCSFKASNNGELARTFYDFENPSNEKVKFTRCEFQFRPIIHMKTGNILVETVFNGTEYYNSRNSYKLIDIYHLGITVDSTAYQCYMNMIKNIEEYIASILGKFAAEHNIATDMYIGHKSMLTNMAQSYLKDILF